MQGPLLPSTAFPATSCSVLGAGCWVEGGAAGGCGGQRTLLGCYRTWWYLPDTGQCAQYAVDSHDRIGGGHRWGHSVQTVSCAEALGVWAAV